MTGESRDLPEYDVKDGHVRIPLHFEAHESYFVVFNREGHKERGTSLAVKNFPLPALLSDVTGPWKVSFDPRWGGPAGVVFDTLADWSGSPVDGIKFYSGIARYHTTIVLPNVAAADNVNDIYIDLGEVHSLARVFVNGKNMGVVWAAPYRLNISDAAVAGENNIEIDVANLWPNRLIGDAQKPDDGIRKGQWPEWLVNGKPRTSGRYTFTTFSPYTARSPLLRSGLIGPVTILASGRAAIAHK